MSLLETISDASFYVVGGTLQRDALCYVVRRADHELYENLVQGNFCYVLTPRQMGKSSLMIRTSAKLRTPGAGVVILDLTAAGQNLSVEQWYGGLLMQMGEQLDLEDELLEFWGSRTLLSPLQRWLTAVCEIALPHYPQRLTIFVDEIDAVRSLPFSTNEFFAGIRELYNRRTLTEELHRLTFCLLGVATPSDLISDTRTTPFNIGRRIELLDFTEHEAAPLAQGLLRDPLLNARLLKRILHWTNGHPYLTQRLCQAVADDESVQHETAVDHLCEELFLSARARERDDNLIFVRERLLRGHSDLAAVLELYTRVRQGKPVHDDDTNPLFSLLQLSGVTRVDHGRLVVRNRIYAHAFDLNWIKTNMPDAEVRRQRAAFRRGMLRATAVIGAILLAFLIPTHFAFRQQQQATRQEASRRELRYAADMYIATHDWEQANITRLRETLEFHQPVPGRRDLRGFEWFYFWRLLHQERATFKHQDFALAVALSPDGKTLASAGRDNQVYLWDRTTGQKLALLAGHKGQIWALAFSPDGQQLASASWDKTVKIWNVAARRIQSTLIGHRDKVCGLAFSPDGKMIATGSWDKEIRMWDAATGTLLHVIPAHSNWVWAVAFSHDGKELASASEDKTIKLWDSKTGAPLRTLAGHEASVYAVTFSPDDRWLGSGGNDGAVILWEKNSGKLAHKFSEHTSSVNDVRFSPNGLSLASAGVDRVVRIWDLTTRKKRTEFKGHADEIRALAFSPDGLTLATASEDNTVKLWQAPAEQSPDVLSHDTTTTAAVFTPDGQTVITASKDTLYYWRASTGESAGSQKTPAGINNLGISPDGRFLAVAQRDNTTTIWELPARQLRTVLTGHQDIVFNAVFSPDNRWLATSARDHQTILWDVNTFHQVHTFTGHTMGVKALAFTADCRSLITGSSDHTVRIWDLPSKALLSTLSEHTNEIWALATSPDGQLIATGSYDRSVKVWDRRTGKPIRTLRGHATGVKSLTFSPDGKRLISGGLDGAIEIWDTATGNELSTLRGHTNAVVSLAFSPDGRTLASASWDGTVHLWRAAQTAP